MIKEKIYKELRLKYMESELWCFDEIYNIVKNSNSEEINSKIKSWLDGNHFNHIVLGEFFYLQYYALAKEIKDKL